MPDRSFPPAPRPGERRLRRRGGIGATWGPDAVTIDLTARRRRAPGEGGSVGGVVLEERCHVGLHGSASARSDLG